MLQHDLVPGACTGIGGDGRGGPRCAVKQSAHQEMALVLPLTLPLYLSLSSHRRSYCLSPPPLRQGPRLLPGLISRTQTSATRMLQDELLQCLKKPFMLGLAGAVQGGGGCEAVGSNMATLTVGAAPDAAVAYRGADSCLMRL